MTIDHTRITDRINLLVFENQRDITLTFLRFQEHYESPQFRGKIFSLEEFRAWYTRHSPNGKRTGRFTYYEDWNGFNLPSPALQPFKEGRFDPLSRKEQQLLEVLAAEEEPFYVIGAHREVKRLPTLLQHEIAHGLFYIDVDYKQQALEILAGYDVERMKEKLRLSAGYHDDILADEVHAYCIANEQLLRGLIPDGLLHALRENYAQCLEAHRACVPATKDIRAR